MFILLVFTTSVNATDTRLKAMGEMTYSVPDIDAQVNLFQVAQNSAWLKLNDSTNWMIFNGSSYNNWGTLKRHWDAEENQFHCFSFSGIKHLDEKQIFYGFINYNWDFRRDVNNSIEKNPYGADPFVLADYTKGNFLYHGPEIYAAYNYLFSSNLYFGISLRYYINRGLKNKPSEAEVISREINASIDLIYRYNSNINFGLSFMPYQTLDITKLVELKDGLTPVTRRYRGEFYYREKVSTDDRSAQYDGYIIRPQFAYRNKNFENVIYCDYYYQWHKIFDRPIFPYYDGYFQAQHIKFYTINRYLLHKERKTFIILSFIYEKVHDWAKEPQDNLLIFKQNAIRQVFTIGVSSNIPQLPVLAAIEIQYELNDPDQKDYLANIYRKGQISDFQTRIGFEYSIKENFDLRFGLNYRNYNEDEVWNYYNDFQETRFTFGSGWRFSQFELDIFGEVGLQNGRVNGKSRTGLNFIAQLKQYL